MQFFIYIFRCSDNSYYVGHTDDLGARLTQHAAGRGATWTAARLPVTLIYSEPAVDREQAIAREKQIKNWSRAKKDALIHGQLSQLKLLSRSRATANKAIQVRPCHHE